MLCLPAFKPSVRAFFQMRKLSLEMLATFMSATILVAASFQGAQGQPSVSPAVSPAVAPAGGNNTYSVDPTHPVIVHTYPVPNFGNTSSPPGSQIPDIIIPASSEAAPVPGVGRRLLEQNGFFGYGLRYNGGPIINDVAGIEVNILYYGSWTEPTKTTSTRSIVQDFLSNLGGSPYLNIIATLTDTSNVFAKNAATAGAVANVVAGDACFKGNALTDTTIAEVIACTLSSGLFPNKPDFTRNIYVMLTSAEVNNVATGGEAFCTDLCGFHETLQLVDQQGNKYPNVRFVFSGNPAGCPLLQKGNCYAFTPNDATFPNNNADGDTLLSVVAHEIFESMSDPDGVSGWRNDNGETENADLCAYQFGTNVISYDGGAIDRTRPENQPKMDSNGRMYSVILPNGFKALVQGIFISKDVGGPNGGGCVLMNQYTTSAALTTSTALTVKVNAPVTLQATVTNTDATGLHPTSDKLPPTSPDTPQVFSAGALILPGTPAFVTGSTATISSLATLTTSFPASGTYQVTTSYPGSLLFSPSPKSSSITFQVQALSTSIIVTGFQPSSPVPYGTQVVISATITDLDSTLAPTSSTVTFYDGQSPLGDATSFTPGPQAKSEAQITLVLPPGTYFVDATYAGNQVFAPSGPSAGVKLIILKAPVSGTVTVAPPNRTPATLCNIKQPETLTATFGPAGPDVNNVAPTGTVSFYISSATPTTGKLDSTITHVLLGTATLVATPGSNSVSASVTPTNGSPNFEIFKKLPPGNYIVDASYSGDNNFLPNDSTINFTVDLLCL